MTLSDLEWPFHASRAISVVAEFLVEKDELFRIVCRLWKFGHYLCFDDVSRFLKNEAYALYAGS